MEGLGKGNRADWLRGYNTAGIQVSDSDSLVWGVGGRGKGGGGEE